MATFFADFFDIEPEVLDEYGAFNVSLINDLPLFIDPFLLFNSEKKEYQELHDRIINYLIFLRDKSKGYVDEGLLRSWYCFKEVKQNWLGFSITGNGGSGLGMDFARSLHVNLHKIFSDFGKEKVTQGSHLEKVCLIREGIGKDNISDFTTNLIKDYLCKYTEKFSQEHLSSHQVKKIAVPKVRFNYQTESWESGHYTLPWIDGDYVILTPKDMLTRDETWINRRDLIDSFQEIPPAIPNVELRSQISSYFFKALSKASKAEAEDRYPTKKEIDSAAIETIYKFPQIIDYYIRLKEERGDDASDISSEKVFETQQFFIEHLRDFQSILNQQTNFYRTGRTTYEETHARLAFLKDVIENKGGHRIFYHNGSPIEREKDLQILYRLVWYGTPSDVTTEANDGRGPVDFKISRGARDKTLVEMKLAKNTKLERNLEKQVPIYQAASDAQKAIKAIIFFTESEQERTLGILDRLGILGHKDVVLIDARNDNKPSGSKA